MVQLTGADPKPPLCMVWEEFPQEKKKSVGQEHVHRCEGLGHGQEMEQRGWEPHSLQYGWEPQSLQYRWVLGAAETANL